MCTFSRLRPDRCLRAAHSHESLLPPAPHAIPPLELSASGIQVHPLHGGATIDAGEGGIEGEGYWFEVVTPGVGVGGAGGVAGGGARRRYACRSHAERQKLMQALVLRCL
jgi:hypothetical protein